MTNGNIIGHGGLIARVDARKCRKQLACQTAACDDRCGCCGFLSGCGVLSAQLAAQLSRAALGLTRISPLSVCVRVCQIKHSARRRRLSFRVAESESREWLPVQRASAANRRRGATATALLALFARNALCSRFGEFALFVCLCKCANKCIRRMSILCCMM